MTAELSLRSDASSLDVGHPLGVVAMADPTTRLNRSLEGRYRIERELDEGGMATGSLVS